MIAYEPGTDGIEAFVATGTAIALAIAGAASAGTSIYAAHKQSDTALQSANIQSAASDKAVAAQTQSTKEALDFQKSQAAQDLVTHNATAKANYDQWAARESRISSLGQALGLAPRDIPAFVPTPGPTSGPTGSPTGGPTTQTGPAPPVDGSAASISAWFKSQGVSDHETPYWASKWPELVARGQELGDPTYAMTRLQHADVFGGGGGNTTPTPSTVPTNLATAARFQPTVTGPYTPALQAPGIGTLTSYAQGRA